jgi:hypothetical protein
MTTPDQNAAASDASVLDAAAGVLLSRYGLLTSGDLYTALRNRAQAIRRENGLPPVESLQAVSTARPVETAAEPEEPGHGYQESGDL